MAFDYNSVTTALLAEANKTQVQEILKNLPLSSNQLPIPDTVRYDIPFLKILYEQLPYDIVQDPSISQDKRTQLATEENAALRTTLNAQTKTSALKLIETAENPKILGPIKTIIDKMPELILREVAAKMSQHLSANSASAGLPAHTHTITITSTPIA